MSFRGPTQQPQDRAAQVIWDGAEFGVSPVIPAMAGDNLLVSSPCKGDTLWQDATAALSKSTLHWRVQHVIGLGGGGWGDCWTCWHLQATAVSHEGQWQQCSVDVLQGDGKAYGYVPWAFAAWAVANTRAWLQTITFQSGVAVAFQTCRKCYFAALFFLMLFELLRLLEYAASGWGVSLLYIKAAYVFMLNTAWARLRLMERELLFWIWNKAFLLVLVEISPAFCSSLGEGFEFLVLILKMNLWPMKECLVNSGTLSKKSLINK